MSNAPSEPAETEDEAQAPSPPAAQGQGLDALLGSWLVVAYSRRANADR